MKNTFSTLQLSKKLTLITMVITVASSVVLLTCVYVFLIKLNDHILQQEIKERQAIIEHVFAEPLWTFDQHLIESVSHSLVNHSGFSYIEALKVSDSTGKILYESKSMRGSITPPKDPGADPLTKEAKVSILREGELLGTVNFVISTKAVTVKYQDLFLKIFVFSLFLTALTCFWIYHFFRRTLTIPLNRLRNHVQELNREKYKNHTYSDLSIELQEIGETLNYASTFIRKRNEELIDHSHLLEKLVDERTQELQEQVLKNLNSSRLVALGEVASGIAHEINNPLTVINGQIHKIKRDLQQVPDNGALLGAIEKISHMSNRIVKIIKGLKLIARDGQNDPMSDFEIHSMVEEIKLLVEMKVKSLSIHLDFQLPEEDISVCGREVQISQVLVNLINNSIDAVSALEERWIRVEISTTETMVEFKITDSGKGIPPHIREKMLTPFFTTKSVGKGTGLGLSISSGIIQDHGGTFFYNEDSKNTQFVFTLKKTCQMVPVACA